LGKVSREEILQTAARLFRENGYAATTLDDIAGELSVTKPALYYYISSKHDLLYEICESAIVRLADGVAAMDGTGRSPEERLGDLIGLHVGMFSENPDIINVYLADEGELPAEKREYIRSRSRDYESVYREAVARGVEDGSFRAVDAPTVVRAISGMCNWLSNWYSPGGPMSAGEITEVFVDLVLNGLKREKAV